MFPFYLEAQEDVLLKVVRLSWGLLHLSMQDYANTSKSQINYFVLLEGFGSRLLLCSSPRERGKG